MRKRSILIALFALAIFSLSACSGEQENDREADYGENDAIETQSKSPENTLQGIRMTREYAIEHGILTEEELKGVDFDAMAERYNLLEGNEEQIALRDSLLRLKGNFPAPGYGFDYQYLEDNEKSTETMTTEDFAGLQTIALQYNSGNYNVSLVFDLEEKQAYWGENVELLKRGADPTEQKELSEQDVEDLKALLSDNHVEKWGNEYTGTSEGTTGSFSWSLYYELEDGRIYCHAGSGVLGNNAPDNYKDVADALKKYFSVPI